MRFNIRELPLSRKKGFSKQALAQRLFERGIRYVHLKELGCPKHIRDAYKRDGQWSSYVRAFRAYLAGQHEALDKLTQLACESTACLMCFELDFNRCHRRIVADALERGGDVEAVHLVI
jgi:uncharacterized protein (DUF488 family)